MVIDFWSFVGLLLTAFLFYRFIEQLGKGFPVFELIGLLASLQWILGPFQSYNNPISHYKYYMYVRQEEYMAFVVPAMLLFSWLLMKKRTININIGILKNYSNYGLPLLFIGFFADLASGFVPNALLFFLFLISNFKYVGAVLLLFSPNPTHRTFFYGSLVYLVYRALSSGMFHDLILWSIFFLMFWAVKYRPSFKFKLVIIGVGICSSIAIQVVKAQYRVALRGSGAINKVELFTSIFVERMEAGVLEEEEGQEELNVRLNQGWIISAIMHHVPNSEDYAGGETIIEAFSASLLPRFLNPNKKKAGGRENFMRFTGLPLGGNTSMGTSVIGEAYANFGKWGGIGFMFFWGGILLWYWNQLQRLIFTTPLLVVFVPLLFLQVVKAETELVVVLNHLVKASMVVWMFFWGARNILKWEV
ncbi:hypothetical protein [Persicobacter psychrovividus]|uniref:Oligosaccharide repeat unit polymerase n=1 Tax=Persicobacter psychrovividus TaxID=387638 RepID=A0ABN6L610_9BACT|nr:hypothetical protein PEPS_08920 [Persicobacter psychrovividus]